MTTTLNKLQTLNLSDLIAIITIDIEGDGLDRSINQKLFPKGAHIDPNTRIWSVSFAIRNLYDNPSETSIYTYVCKLPDTVRNVYDYYGRIIGRTTAIHEKETKVPKRHKIRLQGHSGAISWITEIPDYKEFLTKVANIIDNLISRPSPIDEFKVQPILSKGYGDYNYDYLVLKNACNKHGIKFSGSCIVSLSDIPKLNSAKQVSAGHYKLNQEYLLNGIEHNIDDTVLLNDYIYNNLKSNLSLKQINKAIILKQIDKDFASTDTLSVP